MVVPIPIQEWVSLDKENPTFKIYWIPENSLKKWEKVFLERSTDNNPTVFHQWAGKQDGTRRVKTRISTEADWIRLLTLLAFIRQGRIEREEPFFHPEGSGNWKYPADGS